MSITASARERQVLDAQDRGLSRAEMAAELGVSDTYINNVLARFVITAKEPWQENARIGSARLLAAIERAHPEMVRRAA